MKKVFVDTGAWYALKNKNDPDHQAVYSIFQNLPATGVVCYTSDYVVDEAVTLTRIRLKNTMLRQSWQKNCSPRKQPGCSMLLHAFCPALWKYFRNTVTKRFLSLIAPV